MFRYSTFQFSRNGRYYKHHVCTIQNRHQRRGYIGAEEHPHQTNGFPNSNARTILHQRLLGPRPTLPDLQCNRIQCNSSTDIVTFRSLYDNTLKGSDLVSWTSCHGYFPCTSSLVRQTRTSIPCAIGRIIPELPTLPADGELGGEDIDHVFNLGGNSRLPRDSRSLYQTTLTATWKS